MSRFPDMRIRACLSHPMHWRCFSIHRARPGNRKGVMHSHRNVLVEARNLSNAWCISRHDRWLLYTSMSFANSVRTIYGGFLNGSAIFPYDLKEKGFGDLTALVTLQHKSRSCARCRRPFAVSWRALPAEQKFPEYADSCGGWGADDRIGSRLFQSPLLSSLRARARLGADGMLHGVLELFSAWLAS
jgi:hypothetical protein